MSKIELVADRVIVRGPRVDGSYVISLEIGEYEKDKVANVVMLQSDSIVKVTLDQSSDKSDGTTI